MCARFFSFPGTNLQGAFVGDDAGKLVHLGQKPLEATAIVAERAFAIGPGCGEVAGRGKGQLHAVPFRNGLRGRRRGP